VQIQVGLTILDGITRWRCALLGIVLILHPGFISKGPQCGELKLRPCNNTGLKLSTSFFENVLMVAGGLLDYGHKFVVRIPGREDG
jgi:hypothetical protein